MSHRERNRYILGEIFTEGVPLGKISTDKLLKLIRQAVINMFGEQGLGEIGTSCKIVSVFGELGGFFIARVPRIYLSEALSVFSTILDVASKPVTVRVVYVSGKLSKVAKETIHKILGWRHTLPVDYSVSRKDFLDDAVRAAIQSLNRLPNYV